MSTSFYIVMGILGSLSAVNLYTVIAQPKSKARTFGILLTGVALALIIIAIIIALFTK